MDGLYSSCYFQVNQSLYRWYGDCSKNANHNGYHHDLFNSLAKMSYLWFFSISFNFTLWSAGTAKSTILQVLFFVDYYKFWLAGWDSMIRLFLKILEELVHSFFHNSSLVVHLAFFRMVTFHFVVQFPVNSLTHTVVSSLILIILVLASLSHQQR